MLAKLGDPGAALSREFKRAMPRQYTRYGEVLRAPDRADSVEPAGQIVSES
jgi:hypothetical protein